MFKEINSTFDKKYTQLLLEDCQEDIGKIENLKKIVSEIFNCEVVFIKNRVELQEDLIEMGFIFEANEITVYVYYMYDRETDETEISTCLFFDNSTQITFTNCCYEYLENEYAEDFTKFLKFGVDFYGVDVD